MKKSKSLLLNAIKLHYSFKTNTEFAAFLGIAPQTLSSWYTRNTMDYELVYAKCVDVDANWLLSGEGEMLKLKGNSSQAEVAYREKYFELLEKYATLQDKLLMVNCSE